MEENLKKTTRGWWLQLNVLTQIHSEINIKLIIIIMHFDQESKQREFKVADTYNSILLKLYKIKETYLTLTTWIIELS